VVNGIESGKNIIVRDILRLPGQ